MWTLGKTAALAASVRIATSQQGRARLLQARIDLAREIHERVVQRLFGVSLALGSEHGLSEEARRRCADEMQAALKDLRDALGRPLAPRALDTGATLRDELARLGRHYKDLPLELDWEEGVEVPDSIEPLAQSVLAEALRNADKHAQPTTVRVRIRRVDGTFVLEVRNDGIRARQARHRAWACGWRPWRRSGAAPCLSSDRRATTGGSASSCRWRTNEPRPQPARAGGGRPRRRPLGLPAAADRAALGRALPDSRERRRGARAGPPLRAARRAGGPVPRRGVRRGAVRGDPARVAEYARAADLGRRLDLARRPPRPPARRASSPRTGPRTTWPRRCAWSARG